MKKTNLILILVVLLAASLVSAGEGCYLYKESMLYCFDLDIEDALEDCMIYEDCMFKEVFFEEKSCENLGIFPECEEIFCKSACDYEFLGKCLGGEVPAGEEYVWCSTGCCRFEYYEKEYCGFKRNKWFCEVEAKNRDAGEFNFEATDEQECKEICSKALILEEKITEGLVMEEVGKEEIVPEVEVVVEEKEEVEEEIEEETEERDWFWIVLALVSLLVIFYLFYQGYKLKKGRVLMKPEIKRKPRFFLRRKAIKRREERIRKIKEEREQKRREKERKELFRLFGLGEVKERKLSYVDLLEKVAKKHELKDKRRIREEDIFMRVERLFKEKEKKKLTEEEAKEIFEKLKKIIESK